MPTPRTLVMVALAGLALSASPGPSMLYVLSRSVGQSRSAGLASAAGLAVGGILLAVAAALGLAAVFRYSPTVYTATKLAGAAYLIYLGAGMLIEKDSTGQPALEQVRNASLFRTFWQGILVEALNPKTLLFFIAFLPPFVDPHRGSITGQMLLLGALVPLTAVPSDLVVAFAGGTLAQRLSERRKAARALAWLGALILIALGLHIILG